MSETENRLEWVRQLAETLRSRGLYSLKFETESAKVFLRAKVTPPALSVPAEHELAEAEVEEKDVTLLRAQDVGVFRATVPLETGVLIEKGQRFGLVESVSLQHDLVADRAGVLLEVLTQDGDPVEYGQPLLVLSAGEGGTDV